MRGRRAVSKPRLTPDERIYRMKHENKALKARIADLKNDIRLQRLEHKADMSQFRERMRNTIKRLTTQRVAARRTAS
jgi:hypothetical protein